MGETLQEFETKIETKLLTKLKVLSQKPYKNRNKNTIFVSIFVRFLLSSCLGLQRSTNHDRPSGNNCYNHDSAKPNNCCP